MYMIGCTGTNEHDCDASICPQKLKTARESGWRHLRRIGPFVHAGEESSEWRTHLGLCPECSAEPVAINKEPCLFDGTEMKPVPKAQ